MSCYISFVDKYYKALRLLFVESALPTIELEEEKEEVIIPL